MSVLFVLKDFLRTPGGVLFVFYKYINLVRGILPAPWCFHHSSVDTTVFCLAELRPPGYFCPHQHFHCIITDATLGRPGFGTCCSGSTDHGGVSATAATAVSFLQAQECHEVVVIPKLFPLLLAKCGDCIFISHNTFS